MKRRKGRIPKRSRLSSSSITIKVVGVGGGGGHIVSRMNRDFVRGVEFVAVNTDHQDLDHCRVRRKVYIGRNLTRGLGTGMNPELGRQAAEENRSEIAEALRDADLVFLAAGMGGGTGGGATAVVAETAKQQGALTLAFVTRPFSFEGSQRQRVAEESIMRIRDKVDALIVIPNDRIFTVVSKDTPILKAFEAVDDVLKNAVVGIVEIISTPGIINLDFADVRAVVEEAGTAIVGLGVGSGQDRAATAVSLALSSPLLEMSPEGARGVLLGVSGGRDMKMTEVHEAAKLVAETMDPGAKIIFGAYHDRRLKPKQMKVTVIATGFTGQPGAGSLFSARFDTSGKGTRDSESPLFGEKGGKEGEPHAKEPDAGTPAKSSKAKPPLSDDGDAWDLPTFLRRRKR